MAIIRPRTSTISIDPLLAQRRQEAAAREANLERSAQFLNQAFLQQAAIDYAKQQKAAEKAKTAGDAARNRMADDQFMQAPGLTSEQVTQGLDRQEMTADMMFNARDASAEADAMSKAFDQLIKKEDAAVGRVVSRSGPTTPVTSTRQAPYDDLRIADQQQVMDDDSAAAMARFGEDPEFMAMLRARLDQQNNVNMINAMLAPLLAANQPSQGATQPSVADRMPILQPLQVPGADDSPLTMAIRNAIQGGSNPQAVRLAQSLAGRGIDPRTIARFLDPNQPDYSGESAGRVALQQLLRQAAGAR
tara:strand:- start:9849 stop:10760 length:912 start_codon:yes stop_codon:yes gene_type:complete